MLKACKQLYYLQGKTCGVVGIAERIFSFFYVVLVKRCGCLLETKKDRSYCHSGTTPSSLHLFRGKIREHNRQRTKNVKMYVYSGHALSYTKLVHRHATQTEGNKYFK